MLTRYKQIVIMCLQFEMFQTIHKGKKNMKRQITKTNKKTQTSNRKAKVSECGDGSMFFVIDNIESILDFPIDAQAAIQKQADKIDSMMRDLSKNELLKVKAQATRLELDIDLEIEKFNLLLDEHFDAN